MFRTSTLPLIRKDLLDAGQVLKWGGTGCSTSAAKPSKIKKEDRVIVVPEISVRDFFSD